MKNYSILIVLAFLFLNSCDKPYKFHLETPKTITNKSGKFTAKLTEKNQQPIDSVLYSLNGKPASKDNTFDLTNQRLGKHTISAIVFYGGNKNKKVMNVVTKLAAKKPDFYSYEVVNTYPHDSNAFTQGLEFYNGDLYESTGQYGESSIRKVDLKTGKLLKSVALDKKYFGEGITVFKDKIHQLTWQSNIGFIYDVNTFNKIGSFKYGKSREGWGLTHDTINLIKSDGSKKLWFLDPNTHKELKFVEAYTNKISTSKNISMLNELEYVNGKVYANVWQKNFILIINPNDGTIEGVADLAGLQKLAGQQGLNNVLNGIAYNPKTNKLYVTGKRWNKLFEIKLEKK
ncbi:MAG TPA: glutaminyl-peptide cyclotransferase [Flavobacteriia bacterium]|nr:glutaminyl-peptide cyclotransferase [Flavobacteriia bacterium]